MKSFDYTAFKAGWLEGCKQRSIDPAVGPTSFTVCNLTADAHKAAKNEQAALLTLAEVSDVLEAWLALGRWGWGVDLVEWGLISSLLATAIRLTKPKDAEDVSVEIDPDDVSLFDFRELWHEVCREMESDLTPKQRHRLPTWDEVKDNQMVKMPVPGVLTQPLDSGVR